MDYFSVTQTAFLSALVSTGCLLGLLLMQALQQPWKRLLLVGVVGQFSWALTLFVSYTMARTNTTLILSAELMRFVLWLLCLILLLVKRAPLPNWPTKLFGLVAVTSIIVGAGFYLLFFANSSAMALSLVLLLLATLALVFTEQLVRNLDSHRMMKLIGLGLSFLFAFDLVIYGYSLVTQAIPSGLWQARAALAFSVSLALTIGALLFNERADGHYLFTVSRPAAFFSTTLILAILLIGAVALSSVYPDRPGFLATYLFTLALVMALLLLFTLMISRTLRQHFEVFVSKHFFALKYDYRLEWLNANRRVSELHNQQDDYYAQALLTLCTAMRAEPGGLWIDQGAELREMTLSPCLSDAPAALPTSVPFVRTMLSKAWIYAPHTGTQSMAEHNHLLPTWIKANADIWLVAPLIIQQRLIGFAILNRPKSQTEITFEDRDLLTNISSQMASHIVLHQQEKIISDAKQLETYHRLATFIMHDINNVIAQLALIGKNAERHKANPAFVDDMIKTVENAIGRMQGLVQKFNLAAKEQRTAFSVSTLLTQLYEECARFNPLPILRVKHNFSINADKQRLILAIKNLVRNAQEASGQNGQVTISAQLRQGCGLLVVADNGRGMSQRFINEELFRPFSSTKVGKGLGIGAYLTKSYLEQLGASLRVHSTEGVGTRFEITFS
jgi:putative PEP-CTERM system histidine kinase